MSPKNNFAEMIRDNLFKIPLSHDFLILVDKKWQNDVDSIDDDYFVNNDGEQYIVDLARKYHIQEMKPQLAAWEKKGKSTQGTRQQVDNSGNFIPAREQVITTTITVPFQGNKKLIENHSTKPGESLKQIQARIVGSAIEFEVVVPYKGQEQSEKLATSIINQNIAVIEANINKNMAAIDSYNSNLQDKIRSYYQAKREKILVEKSFLKK